MRLASSARASPETSQPGVNKSIKNREIVIKLIYFFIIFLLYFCHNNFAHFKWGLFTGGLMVYLLAATIMVLARINLLRVFFLAQLIICCLTGSIPAMMMAIAISTI